jgi:hypothetical protein
MTLFYVPVPSRIWICRACFRSGEIRILKSNGAVDRIIPFDETNRKL